MFCAENKTPTRTKSNWEGVSSAMVQEDDWEEVTLKQRALERDGKKQREDLRKEHSRE